MSRGIDDAAPPLRCALIGCGQIARLHAERMLADSRVRLAALYDVDLAQANRLQQDVAPDARVCTTLGDLLSLGLDAAVICTPTTLHFEQIQACRERGLHVLCEKPLSDARERIATLVDASRQGPLLSVAYQRRYWSVYRTLRREILSGRWGAVQSITSHNTEHWQQLQCLPGSWRDDPALNPGGFLGDAGSHKIDVIFYITGLRPLEVFAHSQRCGSRVEIVTMLSARLSGGALLGMTFLGNAHVFREDLHVSCEHGDLILKQRDLYVARDSRMEKLTDLEPESNPNEAFVDCIAGHAPNAAPPDCALPVFDFTRAALSSAALGQPVSIEG